jgi:hypothetical protein
VSEHEYLDDYGRARRRLLKLGVYVAPAVITSLKLTPALAQAAPSCGPQVCGPNVCGPNKCTPTCTPSGGCNPGTCQPTGF